MKTAIIKSLVKSNDIANDGLKTLRLILNNLSDLDMGKYLGEMRSVLNHFQSTQQESNKGTELPLVDQSAVTFLRGKGIELDTFWVISFPDGRSYNIVSLLEEYASTKLKE